jgi:hypothetical protein
MKPEGRFLKIFAIDCKEIKMMERVEERERMLAVTLRISP